MAITHAITPTTATTCRCPPDQHSCSHHHQHQFTPHAHPPRRPHSKQADWLLGFLTILCPPAVAYIKTGKQDLWLNVILSLFGWLPGMIHAWYLLLQHPGCHRCDLVGGHRDAAARSGHGHAPQHAPQPDVASRGRHEPSSSAPAMSHVVAPPAAAAAAAAAAARVNDGAGVDATTGGGGVWDDLHRHTELPQQQQQQQWRAKTGAMPPHVLLREGCMEGDRNGEAEKRDPDLPRYAV